jgi:oligopeptidase B
VTLLSERIYRHELGIDAAKDVLVYREEDPTNYIGVGKSKNGKWIWVYSQGTLSTELRYLDAATPKNDFKVFQPRINDTLFEVVALDDRFIIRTNADGAENFKLMECPLDKTGKENWKEFKSHQPDVLIESINAFKNFLVTEQRKNGLNQLSVLNLSSGAEHSIAFEEAAYDVSVGQNADFETQELRYNYTSMITPPSVYDYDMASKEKTLLKQQEVLGGYDKSNYVTERLMAPARDGVMIPISIVYKKGFKKDGKSPLLEYAYGSYGYSIDATFSSSRLSLLDRGYAFAIAHIRGGQEMGRQWYLDGKLMKKMNTFTDFVDCGKFLIDQGYTSAEHLYAQGGSAGGLLMGVVANIAPDQYKGIIADVPFVDVVNTMLDENIPLTTNEYDEWGNPNEKEAYFYMKSYSPYENIEVKAYPNMLVTTGLHDSQVQYFEPAKWVAKLRDMKTDNNVLLLHTNMDFGHGGASGRFDYLKDVALRYAFLEALEGNIQ